MITSCEEKETLPITADISHDVPDSKISLPTSNAMSIWFNLITNVPWTITLDEASASTNWISIPQIEGEAGQYNIEVAVTENSAGIKREAILTISTGELQEQITISQAPNNLFGLDKTELSFSLDAETQTIKTSSSIDFEILIPTNATWLTHSKSNSAINFTTEANTTGEQRETSVIIQSGELKQEIAIIQKGTDEVFRDPIFKTYILHYFDTDRNGKISTEEALAVTEIDFLQQEDFQNYSGITSFKGIELFTNLETLNIVMSQIYELDLSNNTALTVLFAI